MAGKIRSKTTSKQEPSTVPSVAERSMQIRREQIWNTEGKGELCLNRSNEASSRAQAIAAKT